MKDKNGKLEGAQSWRKSCANCGGLVVDDKVHAGMAMIPAGLFVNTPFVPAMHVFYKEKIYPFADGLPKFAALPAAFGGDDKMLNDDGTPK
eukprot:3920691-Prymnesium_polylepis.2